MNRVVGLIHRVTSRVVTYARARPLIGGVAGGVRSASSMMQLNAATTTTTNRKRFSSNNNELGTSDTDDGKFGSCRECSDGWMDGFANFHHHHHLITVSDFLWEDEENLEQQTQQSSTIQGNLKHTHTHTMFAHR
jgi:hypothetical protein